MIVLNGPRLLQHGDLVKLADGRRGRVVAVVLDRGDIEVAPSFTVELTGSRCAQAHSGTVIVKTEDVKVLIEAPASNPGNYTDEEGTSCH